MTLPEIGTFYEIALLIGLATALGIIGTLLRQPMIVAFIAAGILAGPGVLDIVSSTEAVALLSQISIAVLLFLVGLKLDTGLVRSLGRVAVATGLGQVAFTAIIGFVLCLALGLDPVTSLYVAVALTFSSTIIIVKLLSDKREVDSLHGKIALGFLIVQDLFVVTAMVVVSALGFGGETGGSQADLAILAIGAVALIGFAVAFHPPSGCSPDRSGRAFGRASCHLRRSLGCGARGCGRRHRAGQGAGRASGRRDACLDTGARRDRRPAFQPAGLSATFFFLSLGATMDISSLGSQVGPAIVLSLFVLIGNPLIVLAIMGWMGYRKRTGFLAGLTVAQISEFSLIFMAMGVSMGHVQPESIGLVTVVGLITITLSVYMITWSHTLYERLGPYLGIFERRNPMREKEDDTPGSDTRPHDVLVLGLGRYGFRIAQALAEDGFRPLGVDFNPETVRMARDRGFDAVLGDASDLEMLAHLPLAGIRAAISATPAVAAPLTDADPHATVIRALRDLGHSGLIPVTAEEEPLAERYRNLGAAIVLSPYADAAEEAARRLRDALRDDEGASQQTAD